MESAFACAVIIPISVSQYIFSVRKRKLHQLLSSCCFVLIQPFSFQRHKVLQQLIECAPSLILKPSVWSVKQ